jgi:hypothetical protein
MRGESRRLLALLLAGGCGRTSLVDDHERAGASDDGGGDDGADAVQTCEQVDFLFVIDNSASMADNQSKLVANYATFIDGITETVDRLQSIHIGVTTTDAYAYNNALCRELGGLVVETGGNASSSRACGPYAEGFNYMTDADDLEDTFRCAAQVGTEGSSKEAAATAAVAALSSPNTDAGACNDGFVRDGALLVLVIVTDEDAELDPLVAAQALTDAKNGRADDVVIVALANDPDADCALDNEGRVADDLARLTELFRHGFIGPICAPDYGGVFQDAVAVVEAACPGA